MKKIIIVCIVLFVAFQSNAQKKSEVVQAGIEVQRSYEVDYEKGITKPYLEKEEYFNIKGELIEIKEFGDNGKLVKLWFKYKYDNEGNIIEEQELDAKGVQKEKFIYTFEKGLKKEKLTYDEKNRLTKKKTYEYVLRK